MADSKLGGKPKKSGKLKALVIAGLAAPVIVAGGAPGDQRQANANEHAATSSETKKKADKRKLILRDKKRLQIRDKKRFQIRDS